jgi:hypothetical protein
VRVAVLAFVAVFAAFLPPPAPTGADVGSPGFADELPGDVLDHMRTIPLKDCNGNGIPDSVDIQRGYASDINKNGRIDECDPDKAVARRARTGNQWWHAADVSDSVYFSVTYTILPPVTIRYTVPPSGGAVTLALLDSAGATLGELVHRHQENGPYIIQWDRRVKGIAVGPGEYTFRLTMTGKNRVRRLGWSTHL